MTKKILFNSNADSNLSLFRRGIMKRMRDNGWEVHAVCPLDKYREDLEKDGFIVHGIQLSRHGKNPFQDLMYLVRLYHFFKLIRPSIVHSFTIKPNIYGNLAATLAGIPKRINTVSGLGYVYIGSNVKKKILRMIVNLLYRIAFLFSHKIIFQNDDDRKLFTEDYRIVSKKKTIVIKSSGVDCDFFSMETVDHGRIRELRDQFGIPDGAFVVLMAARMIWEKGVKEFVEAAKLVKNKNPKIIFLLAGQLERGSPSIVSEEYLHSNKNYIQWIGHQRDMKHILALSSVVVLPSYREGVPRILLEAMAMEKPIITTNSVGCKDVVEHEKNGIMVENDIIRELFSGINTLIESEEKRLSYGIYGRRLVLKKFADHIVINSHTNYYIS